MKGELIMYCPKCGTPLTQDGLCPNHMKKPEEITEEYIYERAEKIIKTLLSDKT